MSEHTPESPFLIPQELHRFKQVTRDIYLALPPAEQKIFLNELTTLLGRWEADLPSRPEKLIDQAEPQGLVATPKESNTNPPGVISIEKAPYDRGIVGGLHP